MLAPDFAALNPGYGALHPPLQGEGRGPKGRGVGCAALPPAREPFDAVTPSRRASRHSRCFASAFFVRKTAAGGRLLLPLQGKVGKFRRCRRQTTMLAAATNLFE